jgi:hypothetical protein
MMPQHFRTQREVKPATRGEAVAIDQLAAKGTTEVGPHSECRPVVKLHIDEYAKFHSVIAKTMHKRDKSLRRISTWLARAIRLKCRHRT